MGISLYKVVDMNDYSSKWPGPWGIAWSRYAERRFVVIIWPFNIPAMLLRNLWFTIRYKRFKDMYEPAYQAGKAEGQKVRDEYIEIRVNSRVQDILSTLWKEE